MPSKILFVATIVTAWVCLTAPQPAMARCEYKQGETKYLDWARCRYGDDAIISVDLPEGVGWDQCVYQLEAFRPPKLRAVTKDDNGIEELSVNDRSQLGNPCYLTKQSCDRALKASGQY